VPDYNTLTNSL